MPKIVNPVTGEEMFASEAGAEVLRRRWDGESGAGLVERPAGNASRAAWDDYAHSIGLDPSGFESKRALVDAIDQGRSE